MQGGIDPQLPVTFYATSCGPSAAAVPGMHVHAFSPMEIVSAAAKAGVSIEEWLTELRDAGLGSIPGTAAEILDDEVRWVLTKGKLPAAQWVEVVSTAHRLGIPSSSTMMYGHVDEPRHWLGHLRTLRRIQDETAASPSSCRCRSCTTTRRSTWPDWPARGPPSATTARCTPSRGWPCTGGSTTCRSRG
jgi:FO synthase